LSGSRYYKPGVETAYYGVGFGSALAMVISYNAHHSVLWAILHGLLGWIYVADFVLTH